MDVRQHGHKVPVQWGLLKSALVSFILEYDIYKVLQLLCEWTLSSITSVLRFAKYVLFEKKKKDKLISKEGQTHGESKGPFRSLN